MEIALECQRFITYFATYLFKMSYRAHLGPVRNSRPISL